MCSVSYNPGRQTVSLSHCYWQQYQAVRRLFRGRDMEMCECKKGQCRGIFSWNFLFHLAWHKNRCKSLAKRDKRITTRHETGEGSSIWSPNQSIIIGNQHSFPICVFILRPKFLCFAEEIYLLLRKHQAESQDQ